MPPQSSMAYPLGAALDPETLGSTNPYAALAELRSAEPVTWVPALNAWLVTDRELAVRAMRNTETFTVDDPRFTTAAVLGSSMLSLDGDEHERHRRAFAGHFRPSALRTPAAAGTTTTTTTTRDRVDQIATRLVTEVASASSAELRSTVAGPLAVETILDFFGLSHLDPVVVLGWYQDISDAIVGLAVDRPVSHQAQRATTELHRQISATLVGSRPTVLHQILTEAVLTAAEITPETAVVMFGAIETSEAMTANALWHLLRSPATLRLIQRDRSRISDVVEESLRLEPAAAVIDRYTTRSAKLGGAVIPEGDLVTISLLAANRDPAAYDDPDRFWIDRLESTAHVTFVQGPHGCIGSHLARAETIAAITAVLDLLPNIEIDAAASSGPQGLIFRKAAAVQARWNSAEPATADPA